MAREFQIHGQTMVLAKGGAHLSGQAIGERSGFASQVGLSVDQIEITPRFNHQNILIDDFGPNVPPEVMWNLSDVMIRMTLIHYDEHVLDVCMAESMGGASIVANPTPTVFPVIPEPAGILRGAGAMMGNGLPLLASGNHYIQLTLLNQPPDAAQPLNYVFPATYIDSQPLVIPIGTKATQVVVNWRAIPYRPLYRSGGSLQNGGFLIDGVVYSAQEMRSSGALLWYRV